MTSPKAHPLPWLLAVAALCLLAWPLVAQDGDTDTAPDAAEEAEPPGNRLRWSTASEVDNFGYDIYRALSEEGPFERITTEPIPGHGTTDEPSYYEFVDQAIDLTRDYFYYVESVSMAGQRERFTPVIRAKAKQPAGGDNGESDGGEPSDGADGENSEGR